MAGTDAEKAPEWFRDFERAICKDIEEIKEATIENRRALRGYDGHPGLVGRVDRLEQSAEKTAKYVQAFVTGIVLLLISAVIGIVVNLVTPF